MRSSKSSNFKTYLFIMMFLVLILSFVFPIENVKAYKNISSSDVKSIAASPSATGLIIDVRSPEEHRSGYIPNSTNIPIESLKEQILSKNIDRNTQLVVYCKNGTPSKRAAEILDSVGFTNVYYFGGINNWPYELVIS